jgi:hypothetical protein
MFTNRHPMTSTLIGLLIATIMTASVKSDAQFRFKVIARSGTLGFSQIGRDLSINDSGKVAFMATWEGVDGIYVGDESSGFPTDVTNGFDDSPNKSFDPAVQINNHNKVVATDRVVQSPDPNLFFVRQWNANSPGTETVVARGALNWDGILHRYPYDSILTRPSINNLLQPQGGTPNNLNDDHYQIVFSATKGTNPTNTLLATRKPDAPVTQRASYYEPLSLSVNAILRPMLADNGKIVVRAGINNSSPILLYPFGEGPPEGIATTTYFTEIGRSPGISDDGQIVTFYANLTNADALNQAQSGSGMNLIELTPGRGIFASINTSAGRIIQRIASVSGSISSFSADTRVAVNATQANQRAVTVVYIAFDNASSKGIYTSRLHFTPRPQGTFDPMNPEGFTVDESTLVVKQGQEISGLPNAIQDLNLYDPINSRAKGEIAFWATDTAGTQAAVLATSILTWGAKVRVNFNNNNPAPIESYLVALAGSNIILSQNVEVSQDGIVGITQRYPLNTIARIELLSEDALPENERTLNRYIHASFKTVELRNDATGSCFSNGQWHTYYYTYPVNRYVRTEWNGAISALYAIPRVLGTVDYNDVRQTLRLTAQNTSVLPNTGLNKVRITPLHILYAVASKESSWKQFLGIDAYVDDANDEDGKRRVNDPPGREKTFVSVDGGIGIMQLTGDTALYTVNPFGSNATVEQNLRHLWQMSADSAYNIETGAYLLATAKWEDGWLNLTPTGNRNLYSSEKSPEVLEHWREPVRLYNGAQSYPTEVWNIIQSPPSYFVDLTGIALTTPAKDSPPYHIDLDVNGTNDVVLSGFDLRRMSDGNFEVKLHSSVTVSMTVTLRPEMQTAIRDSQGNLLRYSYSWGNAYNPVVLSGPDSNMEYVGTILAPRVLQSRFKVRIDLTYNGITRQIIFTHTYKPLPMRPQIP